MRCGETFSSLIYLADDVPHLLGVDDVRCVDDSGVAGPVHLSSLLVLGLWSREPSVSKKFWDYCVHKKSFRN